MSRFSQLSSWSIAVAGPAHGQVLQDENGSSVAFVPTLKHVEVIV